MRGALTMPLTDIDQERIIPADAGSTIRGRGRIFGPADHPRGCGEHNSADKDCQ